MIQAASSIAGLFHKTLSQSQALPYNLTDLQLLPEDSSVYYTPDNQADQNQFCIPLMVRSRASKYIHL